MNYLKEERLNALAAEYVVGTLRGKARTRYQKLMMQYQAVSDATAQWEQYLTGFAETLPPVTPPDSVWESIQVKLGHKAANDTEFVDHEPLFKLDGAADGQRVVGGDEQSADPTELIPRVEMGSLLVKDLDPAVAAVGDEQAPLRVHGQRMRRSKLTRAVAP